MKLELVLSSNSCEDYMLYQDKSKGIWYEVQFDDCRFNGVISYCEDVGGSDEMWDELKDEDIYCLLKEKAIEDFSKI